ncbi:MAG: TlpA family protein disulfide reductase [Acidobacteriota bacterium]|nr:TlpA family protein disulfide reductase [Acidobacteriota bacterium]
MKDLFKNIIVFIALSFVLSSLISCTNTIGTSKDSTDNSNVATAKNSTSPPAPAAIMQADIKDLEGSTFKLEDKKGKVILVNLWATWCVPCREEMPDLVALQDKYKSNDFEIIGLDSDDSETPEAVKEFAKKLNLNYQLGYADAKLMNNFLNFSKFDGIPQSFLIDREGKLRNVFVGGGAANVNKIKEAVERVVSE